MRGEYKTETMDPSGFVVLTDVVPHIAQVDMGSPFDLFSEVSHPDCRDFIREQYENRMLLQHAMVRNGFEPLSCEWWLFS